jgi:hypothetical protein
MPHYLYRHFAADGTLLAAEKAEQEAIRIQPLYNVVHKAERHRRLKSSSRPPRYL